MATVNIDIDQGTVTLRGAFPPSDEQPTRTWAHGGLNRVLGTCGAHRGFSMDPIRGNHNTLDQEPNTSPTCAFRCGRAAESDDEQTSTLGLAYPDPVDRLASSTTWRERLAATVIAPLGPWTLPPHLTRVAGSSSTRSSPLPAPWPWFITSLASLICGWTPLVDICRSWNPGRRADRMDRQCHGRHRPSAPRKMGRPRPPRRSGR